MCLVAMFNLLHSGTDQELLEKYICTSVIKVAIMKIRMILSRAATKLTLFIVKKDKCDTKERRKKGGHW